MTDRARGHRVGTDGGDNRAAEPAASPHSVLDGFRLEEEGVRVLLPEESQGLLGILGVETTIGPVRRGGGDIVARRTPGSCPFKPPSRSRPTEARSSGWVNGSMRGGTAIAPASRLFLGTSRRTSRSSTCRP